MKIRHIKANCTELEIEPNIKVLFSYETPVAAEIEGKLWQTSQYFSRTTSSHIKVWLDGRSAGLKPQEFFTNVASNMRPLTGRNPKAI